MSGAASLAAAKRRRSKVESTNSRSSNSTSSNYQQSSNNMIGDGRPQLTTQQSFQYIWNRLMQCEQQVLHNTKVVEQVATSVAMNNSVDTNNQNVKLSGAGYDDREIKTEMGGIQQKIASIQRSIDLLASNNNVSVPQDSTNSGVQYIEVTQFNDVMSKVGNDMEGLTTRVAQMSDFLLTLQNNNLVLKNELSKLEAQVDGSSEGGLVLDVNEIDTSSTVVSESGGNEEEGDEDDDNEDDNEDDNNEDVDENATSTSDVLEKLKTLNSTEIKAEVAKELAAVQSGNNNKTTEVTSDKGASV